MAISLRGRTRNPKKGMVTKRRAEFRERGDRRRSHQEMIQQLLNEGGGTISDEDRERVRILLDEKYMKRNDGGMAQKTRTF